jgi:hypothetical protein
MLHGGGGLGGGAALRKATDRYGRGQEGFAPFASSRLSVQRSRGCGGSIRDTARNLCSLTLPLTPYDTGHGYPDTPLTRPSAALAPSASAVTLPHAMPGRGGAEYPAPWVGGRGVCAAKPPLLPTCVAAGGDQPPLVAPTPLAAPPVPRHPPPERREQVVGTGGGRVRGAGLPRG